MCEHTNLLILAFDGHMGCFWFLPITKKVAVKVHVQDFESMNIFISHGLIPKVPASFFSTGLVSIQQTMFYSLTCLLLASIPESLRRDLCVSGELYCILENVMDA